jgi:hypothetical protein
LFDRLANLDLGAAFRRPPERIIKPYPAGPCLFESDSRTPAINERDEWRKIVLSCYPAVFVPRRIREEGLELVERVYAFED